MEEGKNGSLCESRQARECIIMPELLCAYIVLGSFLHTRIFDLFQTIGLQIRNSPQFYLRVILG